MEQQKNNSSLKAIIIVLAILLVGSLAYMYKMSTDSEKAERTFTTEKTTLENELKAAIANYDAAIAENSGLKEELEAKRAEAEQLLAKVEKAEGDAAALKRYKNDYFKLKKQMDKLIAENNALKQQNSALTAVNDSINGELTETRSYNDTLISRNDNLSRKLDKAAKLTITNLETESFKQKRSGRLVETEKARRVDVIKIKFTIAANEVAQAGNKTYYVQVIDSKNNVVGVKKTEQFGEYSLTYSFITNAVYENKTIQVNETLSGDFEKGLYHVNIFDKDQLVADTTFTLK
ncbi:hypothetical protein [Flavobacterium rhizosphaerae]|uniref:Chromosome partitioning protein ParA n=1 Tax=Flavobacterium rhizosphaerae TaxID=3163298 RepID=A0ABW8YTR6_9FLAO